MNPRICLTLPLLTAIATAQFQFEELTKRHLPTGPNGLRASAFAIGDVDGDGRPDIVLAGAESAYQVRLYRNDGNGRFDDLTATNMPLANGLPGAVALGDLDGDQDLDVVVATRDWQAVQLFLNDGMGRFVAAPAASMPAVTLGVACLALIDRDGDHDLDLVVGCEQSPRQTRLFDNNGSGVFRDVTASALPIDDARTVSISVGDVDGDRDPDLVLGTDTGATFSPQTRLYLNNGSGVFSNGTSGRIPVDSDATRDTALADFDGDGDLDLMIGNSGQDRMYRNDGTGVFTNVTASSLPIQASLTRSEDIAFGDIDGDGDLDVLLAQAGAASQAPPADRLYLNNGSGVFVDSGTVPMTRGQYQTAVAALRDVDGDGDLDALLLRRSDQYRDELWFNDGAGQFVNGSATGLEPSAGDVHWALADVDGDGDPDLVAATRQGAERLYHNDGRGNFSAAPASYMPTMATSSVDVASGDFDGDGAVDLVLATWNVGARFYRNDGNGRFVDVTASRLPAGNTLVSSVAVGDVDADGDLDLVIGSRQTSALQNRLLRNNGAGTFTLAPLPANADRTDHVLLIDLDGDQDLDLLCGNSTDPDRIYVNDGSGTFTDGTPRLPSTGWATSGFAAGDVDGDGDVDLVQGLGNNGSRLLTNDGHGWFAVAGAAMPAMPTVDGMILDDLDQDGDPDLLIGSASSLTPSTMFVNDGSGAFTVSTRLPPIAWRNAVVGDVDADGDGDLVIGLESPAIAGNRLLKNLLRHLDSPYVARTGQPFVLEAYARFGPDRWADVVFPYVSSEPASIPQGEYGVLGIDPNLALPLPAQFVSPNVGMVRSSFAMPADPTLVGVTVYAQMILAQLPNVYHLSNVTADLIIGG